MLNLNSLYNAVFKPVYRHFNPRSDYFTVLIDTPEFEPLYQDVNSKLESLMNSEAYIYFHADNPSDIDRDMVEERLSQVTEMLDMRLHDEQPARRYCLLTYFNDNCRDFDRILRLLTYLNRETRDVVTLVVCLSKRMSGQSELLDEVTRKLYEKAPYVDLYIFNDAHTAYYRRTLTYSICGVVIMNADVNSKRERDARKTVAVTAVENYIGTQLSEDGKKWLHNLPAVRWSTLCCKYYDRQYDFLNKYVSDACKNIKQLNIRDFTGMMEEIYRTLIPTKEARDVKPILNQAITLIPHIVASIPKSSARTLNDYFCFVYGDKGLSNVELTLKVTLFRIYSHRIEGIVKKCCLLIFQKCSGFAEENLYEQVCTLLEQYLNSLHASCNGIRNTLKLILDEDIIKNRYEDGVDKYLDKYIQFYEKQKAETFWREVLRLIRIYPENFRMYCETACNYYKQIRELTESLPVGRIYSFEDIKIKAFTAEEILTLDKSEGECSYIRTLFECCRNDGRGAIPPENCTQVFNFSVDSHFYRSSQVTLANDSYTLCGCELNGQYFVSIGGKQDV